MQLQIHVSYLSSSLTASRSRASRGFAPRTSCRPICRCRRRFIDRPILDNRHFERGAGIGFNVSTHEAAPQIEFAAVLKADLRLDARVNARLLQQQILNRRAAGGPIVRLPRRAFTIALRATRLSQ